MIGQKAQLRVTTWWGLSGKMVYNFLNTVFFE
jgi:hypothetical protein